MYEHLFDNLKVVLYSKMLLEILIVRTLLLSLALYFFENPNPNSLDLQLELFGCNNFVLVRLPNLYSYSKNNHNKLNGFNLEKYDSDRLYTYF